MTYIDRLSLYTMTAACAEVDEVRGQEARDAAEAAPYFFLSYAHPPWNGQNNPQHRDIWPVKLFEDLCARVGRLGGLTPAAAKYVGLMDRGQWAAPHDRSAGLARGLARCRVFVPLVSRRYFASEDCGKEWFAFTRRPPVGSPRDRTVAGAIIPALWVPVDTRYLPPVARAMDFIHPDLGGCYAAHGFYGLIKLTKYRDAYEQAVEGLARLITRAAAESPVARGSLDYDASLVSAFGARAGSVRGGHPLRITVVAPRPTESPHDSRAFYYGPDAADWNPYAPHAVRGLADHAADLARGLGYDPDVGDLGRHGRELLRGGPPTSPAVLIVDAWSATNSHYASLLRRLDAINKPWIQVMVPWPCGDAQDEAVKATLWPALASALGHKLVAGRATSSSAVSGIHNLEDFSRVLPAVIRTAARQYLRYALPFPPVGGPEAERPRLSRLLPDPAKTELPGA
jgi:FxsC-like protein